MEIWKDIMGFEGIYQVSNLGRNNDHSKGEKCNFSKLTAENILFIRKNYDKKDMNQKKISRNV